MRVVILKFLRIAFVMVLILVPCNLVFCQNLSIEGFTVIPFDLSSRTALVKDNNNLPCALIKIVCNDEITNVQGSVVKTEEYGNEYWVYLTAGSKFLKILSRHHKPLDFRISEYFNNGVISQSTYQLELKSDLPPEVLYGSSNPLTPVAMAKDGESLLPKWWNSHEKGMYIGISLPTLDGETAKSSAITNAIYSYIHSSECITQYVAEINISESEEKTQAICRGLKKGFSIKISQEYYNSKGEYFVLCAINDDDKSSNAMISEWSFNDNNSDGELSVNLAVQAKINRFPLNSSMQYCVSWTDSSQQYSVNCNGKELLLNKEVEINDNISDFTLSGDLGLAQLRLLTAIPLLTDTISFSAVSSIANDSYSSATMIQGSGNSRPINIIFYDYNVKGLRFGVSERFPDVEYAFNPDFNRLSHVSGLSEKYFREYINSKGEVTVVKSDGMCDSGLFEVVKNKSLLTALSYGINTLFTEVKLTDGTTNEHSESSTSSIQEYNSSWISKAVVFPIYYLDPNERIEYKEKKYRKDYLKYIQQYPQMVSVAIPIESYRNHNISMLK